MRTINYSTYFWQDDVIRLRAMEPNDWENFYLNRFDTPARRILNYEVELPPTVEEAQSLTEKFGNFKEGTGRLMFVAETLDGENVAALNLNSIDMKNGTFSIGMQVDRENRGKGYGTRAMRIVLRYAFMELRLNKFNVSVMQGNIGSYTMMKKLGCVEEGVRRQVVYTEGQYWDETMFGLTREEFLETEKGI